MKKAYLYCDKRSLNDATNYYLNIVNSCLTKLGYEVIVVYHLNEIVKPNLIFTITVFTFIKAKLRYPLVKTLSWRQGLGLEEAKLNRPIYKWIPYWFFELFTIQLSDVVLFVSEEMRDYYQKKFFYKKNNHVIMPCYNLHIGENFDVKRYNSPTFVYAGGISKWQSIDTLLDTYSYIEKAIPSAKLVMYAKEKEYLFQECSKRGIKNIEVKYVSLDQLQQELQTYKYGFILREKNWVNYVATPTKMNSYLAAYLIPIFSDGVNDFERHINLEDFKIMARTPLNPKMIAQQILDFENSKHDFSKFKFLVESIFDKHYNDSKYLSLILKKMKECGF